MRKDEGYFEMVVVTELIEQELAALRQWVDRRKETIDVCRNCLAPPADLVKQLWATGDQVLRRLGQINRLTRGTEATFARPGGGTGFDWLLSPGETEPKRVLLL